MISKSHSIPIPIPIDSIPLNVAVYRYVDGHFIFVDFNSMAEKTDKIKKEDVIGRRLQEVFPSVEEYGLLEVLHRVYKNGDYEDVDLGFYEDNRTSGWRKNRVIKLENGDVMAIYSDVSIEKETESKLKSLGLIVDNSTNEICMFDKNTMKFTYANQEAQRNIGYTLNEMKSMTPVDCKPEYSMNSFLILIKPLLDGVEKFLLFETIHQRKDGTLYNVEIRFQIMNINNRQQFVAIGHDITSRKNIEAKLQESEEKFRNIAEHSLMGIFIYQEHYVYVNKAFADMLGYTAEELSNIGLFDIIEKPYREQVESISKRRLNGEKFPQEYSDINMITKNGKIKAVRAITQTIRCNNRYAGMGTITDITDLLETKKQLKLLAQAIEQMDEIVRITDKQGMITYVNDALVAHTGYRHSELIGKKISMFKSGHHDKAFYKELWDTILSGQIFRGVFVNIKKDKQIYYEEETITPIMDSNHQVQHFVATSKDITDRVKMEEKLQRLAITDDLTNIYNRYKVNQEIEIEIARAMRYKSSFSLIMIDIDHFKNVNDTYGHDIGDYVLKELSAVVSKLIRESDRFGRWGGEEFMIIAPNIEKEQVIQLANKLRDVISTHTFKNVKQVTISLGATLFSDADTKENLLKRVDEALYESKENGRNRLTFK